MGAMMVRFTMENTEGFEQYRLDTLNEAFDRRMEELGEPPEKGTQDWLAERLLAEYEDEARIEQADEGRAEQEPMTVRFTMDNTKGFKQAQLDMLNASFERWMAELGYPTEKGTQDWLERRVLEEHGDDLLLRTLREVPTPAEYRSRMNG
jgi:hypothetical protein